MTEAAATDLVQQGLSAWLRGDLAALEAILDPAVTLRARQPGPWDCEGRDQVMSLLRLRESERDGPLTEIEIRRIDDTSFLIAGAREEQGLGTLVTVAGGKVTAMQQVSTEEPDPDAETAVAAIRSGDVGALADVLAVRPDLATLRVPGYQGRTLLHIATDWPGNYPSIAATVQLLVGAGADVNARGADVQGETPLHWAASSDDVAAIDALLDAGADIDATGAVIGGGTPLNDATAFGQWAAAQRLFERGARVSPWDGAALGLTGRVRIHVEAHSDTQHERELDELFWAACHGGHTETAAYLLAQDADINWVGYDDLTPLGAAERSGASELAAWLRNRGART